MTLVSNESGLVQSAPASNITKESIESDGEGGENSFPEVEAFIDPKSPVNNRTLVKEADYGAGEGALAQTPAFNPIQAAPPTGAGAYSVGDDVVIVANATNFLTAQWQKDLVDIVGETESVLRLPNVQLLDAGSYTCDFANPKPGVSTSAAVVITVT